jgi:hypothetical protein
VVDEEERRRIGVEAAERDDRDPVRRRRRRRERARVERQRRDDALLSEPTLLGESHRGRIGMPVGDGPAHADVLEVGRQPLPQRRADATAAIGALDGDAAEADGSLACEHVEPPEGASHEAAADFGLPDADTLLGPARLHLLADSGGGDDALRERCAGETGERLGIAGCRE